MHNGNICVTIIVMKKIEIVEYLDKDGRSPFSKWFDGLDSQAAAKIVTALNRMAHGNLSNVKGLGAGISEYKLTFGPGYRIYFGREADKLIILLGGGTKKTQARDIKIAQTLWQSYKSTKRFH